MLDKENNLSCIKIEDYVKNTNLKSVVFLALEIHQKDCFHTPLSFTFFNPNIFIINVYDGECL